MSIYVCVIVCRFCVFFVGRVSSIHFFHDRRSTLHFFKPHFLFVSMYQPLRYLSLFDSRFRPHLVMAIPILKPISRSAANFVPISRCSILPVVPKHKAPTLGAQEVIQGTNSPTEPRFVLLPPHSPSHPLIITNTYPTSAHRVHSHATTAGLINFCQLRGRYTRHPPPIPRPLVECLLKLLNTPGDSAPVRRDGQEQAMIADANEVTFVKVRRVACVGEADRC